MRPATHALFVLAGPALAASITGRVERANASSHRWDINGPDLALHAADPDGGPTWCPCMGFSWSPSDSADRSGGHYRQIDFHIVSGEVKIVEPIVPPDGALSGQSIDRYAQPVSTVGEAWGWGPAPPLPDDRGAMLFHATLSGAGTLYTSGHVWEGDYYISNMHAQFAGDMQILYAAAIPEPASVSLLALAVMAVGALRARHSGRAASAPRPFLG
jgi:hypothetical protein